MGVLLRDKDDRPDASAIDVKLHDFDDVSYHVLITAEDTKTMTVSMCCPCYQDIKDKGAEEQFKAEFGEYVTEPEVGYHCTLKVNTDLDEATAETVVAKITTMKAIVMGGIFERYFKALANGKKEEEFNYKLGPDLDVYFCPRDDRVTIVFGIDFLEDVDKCVANVFMNEFVNQRSKNRSAPPTSWSVKPPAEMSSFNVSSNVLGYISFAVLPTHVTDAKRGQVIHVLQTFRNFLQYHIKMSKSYWHSRMRARTQTLLKVLNRAKVEDPNAKKKTASGKKFGG